MRCSGARKSRSSFEARTTAPRERAAATTLIIASRPSRSSPAIGSSSSRSSGSKSRAKAIRRRCRHAGRELFDAPVDRLAGEPHLFEPPPRVFGAGLAAGGPAEEEQILDGRQLAVEREVRTGPSDREAPLRGPQRRAVPALEPQAPRARTRKAREDLQERGLAAAVSSGHRDEPALDRKGEAREQRCPREGLFEIFGGERGRHGLSSPYHSVPGVPPPAALENPRSASI